jgi:FAD-dependent urate hydroxylase
MTNTEANRSAGLSHQKRFKGGLSPDFDVTVIGAGPYGLSAAAYLKAKGLAVRVVGEPMEFWADKMPSGMLLRSPREASNIADPHSRFTLEAYEAASATRPDAPLPRETFVRYGRWFCEQLGSVPESSLVSRVVRDNSIFELSLKNGASFRSRRVVVAAGIAQFQRKPKAFGDVSPSQVSHCYDGRKIAEFPGKRVAVIGAGQSALESAALLHEVGAEVEIISRIVQLRWIGRHKWLHNLGPISKVLYSKYDVGPAGISRLVSAPNLAFRIPLKTKDRIRTRAVRPAGSPWLAPRLASVRVSTGRTVQTAYSRGDEVHLTLDDGSERRVDHVLLGTGYDVDISKYSFLSSDVLRGIEKLGDYPKLSRGFSCSIPGLHFIGAPAARNFGPLLYFVAGTEFASRELSSYVDRNRTRVSS